MNLSKSKYVLGTRCEKLLWLSCYKKEEQEESNDNILENGNKVGELARNLFGEDYILINYNDNYSQMIKETKKNLDNKPNIICEASFSYDGNFCSIDILKNDNDGVEIYEVKSSTEINESYISDISYQTWILKKCGLKVKKSSIVYINSKYTREYKLDLNKLFKIEDVTSLINYEVVEKNIDRFKNIIENKQEPKIDLSLVCKKSKKIFSYDCPYFKYCTKELPHPNVFDIGWNVHFSKKLEMYHNNKITFNEIINDNDFNEKANKQLEFEVYNLKDKVDEKEIKDFLDSITYPLYFLDFESYQEPIPRIVGTKPYQQICFQYSLHYYLEENGELYHKEFLSDDYKIVDGYLNCFDSELYHSWIESDDKVYDTLFVGVWPKDLFYKVTSPSVIRVIDPKKDEEYKRIKNKTIEVLEDKKEFGYIDWYNYMKDNSINTRALTYPKRIRKFNNE